MFVWHNHKFLDAANIRQLLNFYFNQIPQLEECFPRLIHASQKQTNFLVVTYHCVHRESINDRAIQGQLYDYKRFVKQTNSSIKQTYHEAEPELRKDLLIAIQNVRSNKNYLLCMRIDCVVADINFNDRQMILLFQQRDLWFFEKIFPDIIREDRNRRRGQTLKRRKRKVTPEIKQNQARARAIGSQSNKLLALERDKPYIETILVLHGEEVGLSEIARRLSETSGKRWYPAQVSRILNRNQAQNLCSPEEEKINSSPASTPRNDDANH